MLGLNLNFFEMLCISTWALSGIFEKGANLKQSFFHLVLVQHYLRTEMTNVKQSVTVIYNICCEFMVLSFMCNAVHLVEKTKQTVMKTRHVFQLKACKNMLRGRVVVPFFCEAIEKEEKLSIAPSKIEIFSQQDARRCLCQQLLLLVAVASNDDLPVCV